MSCHTELGVWLVRDSTGGRRRSRGVEEIQMKLSMGRMEFIFFGGILDLGRVGGRHNFGSVSATDTLEASRAMFTSVDGGV